MISNTPSLAGRTAFVTGASRGIGAAIAKELASRGAAVVVGYGRGSQAAQDVVSSITAAGGRALALAVDIAEPSNIAAFFEQAAAQFGKPDIVIANAGVELIDIPFVDYSQAQYDEVFNVNTRGTFFTLQAAARHVQDGGRVILVCSNTTLLSLPGFAVYGASKLAPKYFVEVLAKEIGMRSVTVNSVSPGVTTGAGVFTQTPDGDAYLAHMRESTPLKRLGTPEDVARVVAFLAGPDAAFITGHHISADGGAAL
jgi:3-oxoacyl-[acyl-carrier protein] reductase